MQKKSLFKIDGSPTVWGTGLIALDVVVKHGDDSAPRMWAGGTCGNVLAILSYLGWKSFPIARLKSDSPGRLVLKDLVHWGVDPRFATLSPNAPTPIVIQKIRQDAVGEPFHTFSLNCPNCGGRLPRYRPVVLPAIERAMSSIPDPKVFFLDRVSPGGVQLAETAAKRGAVVYCEPSGIGEPSLFRRLLKVTHILKYSHERAMHLGDLIASASPLIEIQTLGRGGLRYRTGFLGARDIDWRELDAFAVTEMKDSSGAGDWCSAGVIHALCQHGQAGLKEASHGRVIKALYFGQALAAWNCRFEGARGGMYVSPFDVFQNEAEDILTARQIKIPLPETQSSSLARTFQLCPTCKNSDVVKQRSKRKLRRRTA